MDKGPIDQELLEAALRNLLQGGLNPGWGTAGPSPPSGAPAPAPSPYPGVPYGAVPYGSPPGYPPPPGMGPAPGQTGFQQALIWAALGAAAAYVLSDAEIRDRLIRQALKLYGELMVGYEEMKEKWADLRAEAAAAPGAQGSSNGAGAQAAWSAPPPP